MTLGVLPWYVLDNIRRLQTSVRCPRRALQTKAAERLSLAFLARMLTRRAPSREVVINGVTVDRAILK